MNIFNRILAWIAPSVEPEPEPDTSGVHQLWTDIRPPGQHSTTNTAMLDRTMHLIMSPAQFSARQRSAAPCAAAPPEVVRFLRETAVPILNRKRLHLGEYDKFLRWLDEQ